MRIGFVVNDVKTEEASYTTIRLACEAINLGHEVWVIGVGDIAYDPDEKVHARAYSVPPKKYKKYRTLFCGNYKARVPSESGLPSTISIF